MLSDEVQASLDKTLGLVTEVVGEEFNKRFQRGDFGPLFATLTQTPTVEDEPPAMRRLRSSLRRAPWERH